MVEELNIRESHQGFVLSYESRAHRVEMRSPHRHRELELNLIVRGQAEYVLAHQRYRLRPGSLVWLFPGQEHLLTKTDAHFKMYVVVFREPLFRSASLKEKYRTLAESDPAGSFCRRVSLPSWQPLEQVCQSLCALNTRVDTACPAYHYAGQAFGFESNAEYRHADPEVLNAGLSYLMITGWHLFVTEGGPGSPGGAAPARGRSHALTPVAARAGAGADGPSHGLRDQRFATEPTVQRAVGGQHCSV